MSALEWTILDEIGPIGVLKQETIDDKGVVRGMFVPGENFKKYEVIFRELDEAINTVQLTWVDDLEKVIKDFKFFAIHPVSRVRIPVFDLTIVSEVVMQFCIHEG